MIDIPYYYEVYGHPMWRFNQPKPHMKRSFVIETSKVVEIKDLNGVLRYQVSLLSSPLDDGQLGFQVKVICYALDNASDNIAMHFPAEDEFIPDAKQMEKLFDACVRKYNDLVKAETSDFTAIDIYKSRIGYEVVKPDCCMFCKWCQKSQCGNGFVLECHSPENQVKFAYMVDFPQFPSRMHCHKNDGWQKLPWMKKNPMWDVPLRDPSIVQGPNVFPKVSPFGKCNSFEKPSEEGCNCNESCNCNSNNCQPCYEMHALGNVEVPYDPALQIVEDIWNELHPNDEQHSAAEDNESSESHSEQDGNSPSSNEG